VVFLEQRHTTAAKGEHMISAFRWTGSERSLPAVALFSIALGLACSAERPLPTASGTVHGRVTAPSAVSFAKPASEPSHRKADSDDGGSSADGGLKAVSGAVCTLEGTNKSATTDENGYFTLSDVAPGSYILICKKTAADGKVYAALKIVEVGAGLQPVDLGTLEIVPTGNIRGKATLGGQTDQTGIAVYVPGSSFQARTDTAGAYLLSNTPAGTYRLRFEMMGYQPRDVTGIEVRGGETTVVEDVLLTISTGAGGTLVLAGGSPYSNSRTVNVTISPTTNAALMQLSEEPTFVGATWQPVATTTTWTFASDGLKKLYLKLADANGLESAPVWAAIVIDTVPPNGTVQINSGAAGTNNTGVTLSFTATDATTSVSHLKVSNLAGFSDAGWEAFASTKSWTLSSDEGTKTVYAKFRDAAGNESEPASATIALDTTPPSNPSLAIQEGAYTNTRQIHLLASAIGASQVKASESPDLSGALAVPLSSSVLFTLSSGDGPKTVYARLLDEAGNESTVVSASVVLDMTPPSVPSNLATSPVSPANNNNPTVTGQTEPGERVQIFPNASCSGSTFTSATADGSGAFSATLSAGDDTTTTFTAMAFDALGNASGCSGGVTYVEDSTAPVAPVWIGTTPPSPSRAGTPTLQGTAELGSRVDLFIDAACGGAIAATTTATGSGTFSFQVSVADNSTTAFSARATDAAGNVSLCSTAIVYIHDIQAPAAPSLQSMVPASPAWDPSPHLVGTAEPGATVNLYTDTDCSGPVIGSGIAGPTGAFDIVVTITACEVVTSFRGTAIDAAGNVSACSLPIEYRLVDYAWTRWPSPPDLPPEGNYSVTADTVTDAVTGLVWQRNVPSESYHWEPAKAYCAGLTLPGGQTGWRLPTRIELLSIVDLSHVFPSINVTAFPGTPSEWFWSSSHNTSGPWGVNFSTGGSGSHGQYDGSRVRCVR
jgi:hypothetical protein